MSVIEVQLGEAPNPWGVNANVIVERSREYLPLSSTLFLVKVTFIDFSIDFLIGNKGNEWFEM